MEGFRPVIKPNTREQSATLLPDTNSDNDDSDVDSIQEAETVDDMVSEADETDREEMSEVSASDEPSFADTLCSDDSVEDENQPNEYDLEDSFIASDSDSECEGNSEGEADGSDQSDASSCDSPVIKPRPRVKKTNKQASAVSLPKQPAGCLGCPCLIPCLCSRCEMLLIS
jgi:hypothetical protein